MDDNNVNSSGSASVHKDEITIGIICALPVELKAVRLTFDHEYESIRGIDKADRNTYTAGILSRHRVVIAVLPAGRYGTVSAAGVAMDMSRSCPSMKAGLMVGISGGIPSSDNDVRLGDVIVSKPQGEHGGVVQYDLGRQLSDGVFQRLGALDGPPQALLTALNKLEADHRGAEPVFPKHISEMLAESPRRATFWDRPQTDLLYQADHPHAQKSFSAISARSGCPCKH